MKELDLLKSFVLDNHELEQLEDLLNEFNLFQVLGISAKEERHSNFLGWLLNPGQNHGIGDYFLKKFLIIAAAKRTEIREQVTPIDIQIWDLAQANVKREWNDIDIFIEDPANQFVCAIENKVFTMDHDNQLSRYREIVQEQYPGYKKLFIFLTPGGDPPIEEGEEFYYVCMSYEDIHRILERLLAVKERSLSEEVKYFIQDYTKTVRRRIMGNSDIQRLAQQIYEKHKEALDLIFEYRLNRQQQIHSYLKELVASRKPNLIEDVSTSTMVRFSTQIFDSTPLRDSCFKWTKTGRLLLFEFKNPNQGGLDLQLHIGPNDPENGKPEIREKLLQYISSNKPDEFNDCKDVVGGEYIRLYSKKWIRAEEFKTLNYEALKKKIDLKFEEFTNRVLPRIHDVIGQVPFI